MAENYITTDEARAYDVNDLGPAYAILRDLADGYAKQRQELRASLMRLMQAAQAEVDRLDKDPEYIPFRTFGIARIIQFTSDIDLHATRLSTIMELSKSARLVIDGTENDK